MSDSSLMRESSSGSDASDEVFVKRSRVESEGHSPSPSPSLSVIVVLVICLLFSSASLAISVIFIVSKSGDNSVRSCVRCEDLSVGPPQFTDTRGEELIQRKQINGEEFCCATKSEQIPQFYDLMVQSAIKRERAEWADDCGINASSSSRCFIRSNETTAAHVVLTSKSDIEKDPEEPTVPVIGWSATRNPGFITNIRFDGDRLVILHTGLYYVYSQLALVEFASGSDDDLSGSIVHHVERWNIVYPDSGVEKLLRHSESRVGERGRAYTEYVSYVGCVLPLRAGDELYVTTSHPQLVQLDTKSSFFGMYRI